MNLTPANGHSASGNLHGEETIVAVASPMTPAPRGIVRLSGSDVAKVLGAMGIAIDRNRRTPHRIESQVDVGSPMGSVDVDVLMWPTRRSYTGAPSAELHVLGCAPLLSAVVDRAIQAGARAAQPGEFTMRSFMAGRLDLVQAEAVLGVIEADDAPSLDRALHQLAGNLSQPLLRVRDTLLNLIADVEAGLDFVDEDIEFITDDQIASQLDECLTIVQQAAAQLRQRGPNRGVTSVVLLGYPNAGKSRLVNTLVGENAVIVSSLAGTTRDTVEIESVIEGHTFRWIDTAGLENEAAEGASGEIMQVAQSQAINAAIDADIRLWCVDGSEGELDEVLDRLQSERRSAEGQSAAKRSSSDCYVATKSDRRTPDLDADSPWIPVSSVTGDGLETLIQTLVAISNRHDEQEIGGVIGTAARCRDAMSRAVATLASAADSVRNHAGHELVAGDLRVAVEAIGEVTGQIVTDDILDRIFSRFCIGK